MKRPEGSRSRRGSLLLLSILSSALLVLVVAGCTVGPIDFSSGTPGPTQPAPGADSTATPQLRPISGLILDVDTGKPIEGAEITASGVLTATAADGLFYFEDVPAGAKISVSADGYKSVDLDAGSSQQIPPVKLKADLLTGIVTDGTTGLPLAGVLVRLTLPVPVTVTATETITNGTDLPPDVAPTGTVTSTDSLRPNGLAAPVAATKVPTVAVDENADPTSEPEPTSTSLPPTPTPNPSPPPPVGDGYVAVYTDANGQYTFKNPAPGSDLTFKMAGYKLVKTPVDGPKKDVVLEQFRVQAFYMTANVASVKSLYDELVDFAQNSRFNAIVLNVQTDASEWVFDTHNEDAVEAGNVDEILPNIADVVKDLKSKGFYTIARIATFQQKTMALARPDLAVMSSVTGKPWRGGYTGQQAWLDVSNPKTQDHLIAMTKEVLTLGFDEIQYDYVRFPSDPWVNEPGKMVFSTMPMTDTGKVKALQQFLGKAHAAIMPTDAFMSIDVFGYALWPPQDGTAYLGVIGQVLPDLVGYSDYICPMIYPSHFSAGEQNCPDPASCAYKLVKKSGEFAAPLFAGSLSKYRPWLEDFDWGDVDYTSPGTTKVKEQIQACEETDCWGWMMWDAANQYEPRSVFKKP